MIVRLFLLVLLLLFSQKNIAFSFPLHGGVIPSGDPTSGVLLSSNDAYVNWTKAGLQSIGGIPTRTTQCGATVNPTGITPPASGDDASVINAAITACTAGQVVQLAAGTFNIAENEQININKGITLRGSGSPSGVCTSGTSACWPTIIYVYNGATVYVVGDQCSVARLGPGTGGCTNQSTIEMGTGIFQQWWAGCSPGTVPTGCGTALTADAAQGATSVQVTSTTHLAVGQWVLIDEASNSGFVADSAFGANQVYATADSFTASATPVVERTIWQKHNPSLGTDDFTSGQTPLTAFTQGCYWSFCDRPVAEIHKITSIVGTTVTFDSPLTIAFRISGGHNAQLYYPTGNSSSVYTPFVEQAGIENLTIERTTSGAVTMAFCAYCWVKNVEARWWNHGAVNVNYGVRDQVEMLYSHDCADSENSGAEYALDLQNAATEILFENNILATCGKPMTARGGGAGSVIAYSFLDPMYYLQACGCGGNAWEETAANGSHSAGAHHLLFEGNQAANLDSDDTHGSVFYETYFRNWGMGFRTPFTDPSNSATVNDFLGLSTGGGNGPFRTAGPMGYNYWFAYVGNVLGTSGQMTGWANYGSYNAGQSSDIWYSGWINYVVATNNSDAHLTMTGTPFIQRHANYDYLSGTVTYQAGYSTTIPNSFYLSGAPGFFGPGASCTYPWPWVTPQGGTQILVNSCSGAGLPAKARYDAGTPFAQP